MFLGLAMMIFAAFASYAADTDEIGSLHAEGVRIFDDAGLLSEDESSQLEEIYDTVADETGFDVAMFTTDSYDGAADADDYADMLFYEGDFGTGSDKSGAILVINMGEREAYIYTHGTAIRYITDSEQNYIFDELDGGLYSYLADGQYAEAGTVFAEGVYDAYKGGISDDQSNYNEDTGRYDPYVKKGISPFEFVIAFIISAVCGIIPVCAVRSKYAMKSEKHMAEGFNLAYRANAAYSYAVAPGN
ncbi:MAG: TPM domain-containing protein, partial [bacterium]|nr:TPM domain-containing protein [bacterium]